MPGPVRRGDPLKHMKMRTMTVVKSLAVGTLMAMASPVLLAADDAEKGKPAEAPLVGSLKDLKKLSRSLVGMAEESGKATVSLMSRGGGGAGSGVIVSEDGLILTAAHVLAAMSDEVIVVFPDGSRKEAKPLGADFDRDAAMVQITEKGSYPYVEVGGSEDLKRNQWCVALGHPGGFDPMRTPPVRLGRVLRKGDFVVTDCAVVGGDSGGPLFDVEGKLIGIHSNIGATLSENRHVPVDVYHDQWDALKEGERSGKRFAGKQPPVDPDRPVMGVQLGEPSNEGGVVVNGVMDDSPASAAGIQEGDVITSVNGKSASSAEQLIDLVGRLGAGKKAKIEYRRDGEIKKVQVKLARLGDMLKKAPKEKEGEKADEKTEPKEEGKGEDGKDALDRYLDKAIDGETGEVRLELTPEQLEKFGGMARLQERLKERLEGKMKKGKPEEQPKEKVEKKSEEEKEAGKKPSEKAQQASADEMEKMLKQALKDGGQVEMTPEMLEKMGGIAEFTKRLKEMTEKMDPEELGKLMQRSMKARGPDKFFESSMKALHPVVAKAAASTVIVLIDGKPAALGTVVSEDGWVLTKDSETRKGTIGVRVGEDELPATLLTRFPKRDLALLKVESEVLRPVRWAPGKRQLPLGALLTASGVGEDPLGIGVVSVKARPFAEIGFLGIQSSEGEGGVLIEQVVKGSPAEKAGLKKGDVILSIDGEAAGEPHEFGSKVRTRKAGDEIKLAVRNGEETRKAMVKLMARRSRGPSKQFQKMNLMSGPLSSRQSGFPEALQHDIPLPPSMCGGPLLDLGGRCVGINVSRAGRVKTLAIPAGDVRNLLSEVDEVALVAAAKEAAEKERAALNAKEREEIRKVISEVREKLEGLEKTLEEMESR